MAFRIFSNSAEAAEYVASLDERWPMRAEIQAHLSRQLAPLAGTPVHVVELCAGAGALAARLLADYPDLRYTGIDASAPLLALARERLAPYTDRITWVEADLNGDDWLDRLPHPVAAMVSLQSLHDLGDAAVVARIYRLARALLAPGGRLVFADLLAPDPPDPAANPGRLSVAAHLASLSAAGFPAPRCTLQLAPFACFVAEVPSPGPRPAHVEIDERTDSMIVLLDNQTGAELATLTPEQLEFMVAHLEEESRDDRDYYINQATVDLFESKGADPALIALLRRALGSREDLEIRWETR